MLLTRMAEEISCRAQSSSNSTAENDDRDDVMMLCSLRNETVEEAKSILNNFFQKQSWRPGRLREIGIRT
eukprot:scaffold12478_cov84-Skeletonema_dohrnii-CCMP3373.AAC.1